MAASDGDLNGAAQGVLAFDLGEVAGVLGGGRYLDDWTGRGQGSEGKLAGEKPGSLIQGAYRINCYTLDQGGLGGAFGGQEDSLATTGAGEAGESERAAHGAGGAGETEFASNQVIGDVGRSELAGGDEDAKGDGQVVERAFLAEVAGGEVNGGAGAQQAETGVGEGGEYAIIRLFDRRVGQPD
ncbi:MAG: hypothetical protein RIQ79_323 [Verrucomicrobiota bacterium]